jgi:hypothetical protein
MDMKKIRVWFSRGSLAGLMVALGIINAVALPPAALAQSFQGTFNGPSQTVNFGVNGPQAVLNMPSMPVSNFDPNGAAMAAQEANSGGGAAMNSLGNAGSAANTSYKSGEAPEDANMSGLTATNTSNPKQNPTMGPGSNSGFSPMTNGLMAPGSVNPASIPLYDGLGYGFNSSPQQQVYSMATGTQALINGVINGLGGGIITTGPVLPVTSTGSVNLNTTMGNGY